MENKMKHLAFTSSSSSSSSGGSSRSGTPEKSQSVLRAARPGRLVLQDCQQCVSSINQYVDLLQRLCGAGTHIGDQLIALLAESPYAEIAGQFQRALAETERVVGREGKQMQAAMETQWGLLQRCFQEENGEPKEEQNSAQHETQIIAKCLLYMLQLQYQTFRATTEILTQFANCQAKDALTCQQTPPPTSQSSSSNSQTSSQSETPAPKSSQPKASQAPYSPGSLRKQISQFFSKFSQKPMVPQSLFYVDLSGEAGPLPEEKQATTSTVQVTSAGQRSSDDKNDDNNNSTFIVEDPLATHKSQSSNSKTNGASGGQHNGQIASEEELDHVINLLSGTHKSPMQAIPENPASSAHLSRAVGSHRNHHNVFNPSMEGMQELSGHGLQKRCSDGLIGETFRQNKTNTWPFRPRQRNSQESREFVQQMLNFYGAYDNLGTDLEYGQFPGGDKQAAKMSGDRPGVLPGSNPWSTGDPIGCKGWPYPAGPEGQDLNSKCWSGLGDSSSCSDESSSNGEVPWMMGFDLYNAVGSRRRHSSVEDASSLAPVCTKNLEQKSEAKPTNTWPPPKQPWVSKPHQHLAPGQQPVRPDLAADGHSIRSGQSHRPVSVQWSDPLMNRNLSVWEPGLTGSLSQQSFGSIPPGSSTEAITVDAQVLETKYSGII